MTTGIIPHLTSEGCYALQSLYLQYKPRFGEKIGKNDPPPSVTPKQAETAHRELLTKIQELLNGDSLAPKKFGKGCKIEIRPFTSKLEGAEFFFNALHVEHRQVLNDAGISPNGDPGLLAGLDALFAEHILRDTAGKPFIGELSRHIFGFKPRRWYRHLIGGPCEVYSLMHDTPNLLEIVLGGAFQSNPDPYEQIAGRRDLITDRGALSLARRLYLDPTTGKFPENIAAQGITGGLRDFGTVHSQLSITKHVRSMPGDKYLTLLPEEFDDWKARSV